MLAFVGPRSPVLASVGLRESSFACVGRRWPALGFLSPRSPVLACVGLCWPVLGFVGPRSPVGQRWASWVMLAVVSPRCDKYTYLNL